MSDHSWRLSSAQCPFIRGETKTAIICEGMVKDEVIWRKFTGAAKCDKVFREFCCKRYKECPVHKLIMTKYQI